MEWINVNDKLPKEYDQEVIVAYYNENYDEHMTGFAYFRENEFYNEGYDIDLNEHVTHWMEIPEHPNEMI